MADERMKAVVEEDEVEDGGGEVGLQEMVEREEEDDQLKLSLSLVNQGWNVGFTSGWPARNASAWSERGAGSSLDVNRSGLVRQLDTAEGTKDWGKVGDSRESLMKTEPLPHISPLFDAYYFDMKMGTIFGRDKDVQVQHKRPKVFSNQHEVPTSSAKPVVPVDIIDFMTLSSSYQPAEMQGQTSNIQSDDGTTKPDGGATYGDNIGSRNAEDVEFRMDLSDDLLHLGQLAMTHQTVLATVTVQKQMEPKTPWPSASNSSTTTMLSTFVNPMPLQQVPPPTPKNCYGDAYNWRKYGQKQVKSSENARSYYRCTGSNCSAKKKVVHCPDGAIIEVIYRGKHNHDPPQKHRYIRDRGPHSGEIPLESQNLEKPNTEPGKPDPPSMTEQNLSTETPKQQLYCSSDCEFDAGTKSEEDIYDEPDPKRRLSENSNCSSTPIQKTIREYVVQTEIDARHLNDGYRWRKYGQKFVKGNSNPRSYYRCTHSGCPVRKHVERASQDAKSLLITYEGEHNHPQPSKYTNASSSTAIKVATAVADEHLGTSPISGKSSSDKSPQNTKAEKATRDSKFELGDDRALESAQAHLNTAVEEAAGDMNLENGGDPAPESAQALLSMEFNSSSGDSSGMNDSEGIKSSMINKTSASVSIHST